jgi:hypothetical protein
MILVYQYWSTVVMICELAVQPSAFSMSNVSALHHDVMTLVSYVEGFVRLESPYS